MKNETLVIIPVFNEQKNINSVVENFFKKNMNFDVLIINDGSEDETEKLLNNLKYVIVLNHPFNMGIGASFETGCQFAVEHNYRYIIRMDGDGQHNPDYIKEILKPIVNNEADIAIGSRFLGESEFKSSFFRIIGIWILSLFLTLISRKKVTDPTSGFCAMNKKAFEFFSRNCPDDYPEPEILTYYKNFRIVEIPISVKKREGGVSSITPLKSVYYMIKVLFSLFMHIFKKEGE